MVVDRSVEEPPHFLTCNHKLRPHPVKVGSISRKNRRGSKSCGRNCMYTSPNSHPLGGVMRAKCVFIVLLVAAASVSGFGQLSPSAKWAAEIAAQYTVNANLTYRTASNQQLKMDVYYRRGVTTPQPTLVYMHGGFWVAGVKETAITALVPW